MADKGGDEPPQDTEYGSHLPSDTASLSDSDPEEVGLPGDAEVDTFSPDEEEKETVLPSLNEVEHPSLLGNTQKSAVQPFHLKGMSSTFSLRSQNIFDCLEGVAKRTVLSLSEDNVEGQFKRPLPPAPVFLNKSSTRGGGTQEYKPPAVRSSPAVPDYVAHPERWTKYSLEEVPQSSDKTNMAVALEFLKDLKNRKEGEKGSAGQEDYTPSFNQDSSSSGAGRIIFAKPTKVGTVVVKKEEKKDDSDKDDNEKKSKSDEDDHEKKSKSDEDDHEKKSKSDEDDHEKKSKSDEDDIEKKSKSDKDDIEKKSKSDKGGLCGRSLKRARAWREEEEAEAGSGHLESHRGKELKNESTGIKEAKVMDIGLQPIEEVQERMSDTEFHSSKKKNRKHIRAKRDPEEGDSS